jgi:hypothetical protein
MLRELMLTHQVANALYQVLLVRSAFLKGRGRVLGTICATWERPNGPYLGVDGPRLDQIRRD